MDIADLVGDNVLHTRFGLTRTTNAITKDYEMGDKGDKGGKKDKEKSKKQKADKEGQKTKGKQDKPQSK